MSTLFDFDSTPDRFAFDSVKWSYPELSGSKRNDVLPLWVADMDFAAPPAVSRAVQQRAAHPVYGYAGKPEAYFQAFIGWMRRWHNTQVERDWLLFAPGIVPAIALALRAYSKPGDGIVIMPPVYHPFKIMIESNGRQCREAPLVLKDGSYSLDTAALDKACRGSRLLLLCSPHNPVGRVWNRQELQAIADIAEKHDILVLADEIHADLCFSGYRHLPAWEISPKLQQRLVAAWAPSKTFNIAGLQASMVVIPDKQLRQVFKKELEASAMDIPNCLALTAATAAYNEGDEWLKAVMKYIEGNYIFLAARLAEKLPAIKLMPCQATYLAWLDLRTLGLPDNVHRSLVDQAGVWLNAGSMFGTGGEGFARLNLACSRSLLAKAIDRLADAFGQT